jgi:hypothetical protein
MILQDSTVGIVLPLCCTRLLSDPSRGTVRACCASSSTYNGTSSGHTRCADTIHAPTNHATSTLNAKYRAFASRHFPFAVRHQHPRYSIAAFPLRQRKHVLIPWATLSWTPMLSAATTIRSMMDSSSTKEAPHATSVTCTAWVNSRS